MRRIVTLLLDATLCLALLAPAIAFADRGLEGTMPSGATFRIAVPDGWQPGDALVLYQHGFEFSPIDGPPSLGPLRDIMLDEGYAIAATSFRQRGWALFHAIDDNRDLLDVFVHEFGAPGEIVPFGGSMGGLVALKLAEAPGFPPVNGAYALCPAAAGSRLWDHAIDLRLAYDVVCDGAGELPQGEEPLPWAFDLDDIPPGLGDLEGQLEVLPALIPVSRCTGIVLPPPLRNDAMEERLDQLMAFGHFTSEDFFVTNIAYATFALADLVRAADKLDARNPFTTAGVAYDDAEIDAEIARIEADPLAALEFRWLSDFRGDVGTAKIVSLHTSRDELVVPANQSVLRERVPASQRTSAIVAEDEPSHCGFDDGEGLAGWEALRAWMAGAPQPDAASLQAACESLAANGIGEECRFDPEVQDVPAFDSLVPPRPASTAAPIDARYSGQWYDPARSGEGIVLEILDDTRAAVYFFTYPPAGMRGEQAWMYGVGTITADGIAFDDLRRPQRVVDESGTTVTEQTRWGRLWLSFDDCLDGRMRWEGPDDWGRGEVPLKRLSTLEGLGCADSQEGGAAADSGIWHDPGFAANSGFVVEQLADGREVLFWFDPGSVDDGQRWMLGIADGAIGADSPLNLLRGVGPRFGEDFDPDAFTTEPGMVVTGLELGCDNDGGAELRFVDGEPVSGPVQLDLQRLTRPVGVAKCVPP